MAALPPTIAGTLAESADGRAGRPPVTTAASPNISPRRNSTPAASRSAASTLTPMET